MLSRVANSVFWMARYVERAENVARFIEVNRHLSLDFDEIGQWAPLVYTTGDHEQFADRYGETTQNSVIQFLTFDRENPNSIISCLRAARENARTVREIISSAMWEELNKFYILVRDAVDAQSAVSDFDFFNRVKMASHLMVGITDSTMSHGEAWHFARLGRLLERADKTSRIVDVKYYILLPSVSEVGSSLDVVQWSALLQSASALEMYRREHGRITPIRVADFLLLNPHFPRSVRFCLRKAEESLHQITGTSMGGFSTTAEQYMGRLRAEIDYTHIDDIIARGMHEFIDSLQDSLNEVGDSIHKSFFASPPLERETSQVQSVGA